ncbi:hypothetical protein [Mesorhizobium sp. B2-3-5]|uniref:hypothetical protein n=1 Tax=Mesorhizobium sp. B2-3-5 TaxID=2589958 RepID=UPI0011277C3E|nr:hypothetical protein [Mesorhizobium sp. B2-3-5]TPM36759.1 hypothetical protein FJ958_02760 [Mesorhizobium sp. B2-3-5]
MDPATAAVMVLLSCSPGETSICKPIDTGTTIYASLDLCMASLKERLASSPNGETIGRCRLVDAAVTGAVSVGLTTVLVTRGLDDDAVTSSYVVPHEQ